MLDATPQSFDWVSQSSNTLFDASTRVELYFTLTPAQREVIKLQSEWVSFKELAYTFGVSEGAIKQRLKWANEKLWFSNKWTRLWKFYWEIVWLAKTLNLLYGDSVDELMEDQRLFQYHLSLINGLASENWWLALNFIRDQNNKKIRNIL